MQLEKVIRERRSIRKYKEKKVPFADIVEICDVARFTPMAGNMFSLKILIVSDKEKIKRISEFSEQPFIADASHILVVCSNKKNLVKSFGENGIRNARQQAGAAIQSMLLEITSWGLASCWIGWFNDKSIKNLLKIPEDIDIEALLPVGYAVEKPKKIFKPELKSILFFDEWNKSEKK